MGTKPSAKFFEKTTAECKTEFEHLLNQLSPKNGVLINHEGGRAILISEAHYNLLLEDIEDLKNAIEAEDEYQRGEFITMEEMTLKVRALLNKK